MEGHHCKWSFQNQRSFKKILEFFFVEELFVYMMRKNTQEDGWKKAQLPCGLKGPSLEISVSETWSVDKFGSVGGACTGLPSCKGDVQRRSWLSHWTQIDGFSSPFVQVESLRDDTGCTVGGLWWSFLRQRHIGSLKPIHCSDPWTMIWVATPFCKLLGHLKCGTKRRKSRPENMLINVYIDLPALKNLQSNLKLGNQFAWTQKLKWCVWNSAWTINLPIQFSILIGESVHNLMISEFVPFLDWWILNIQNWHLKKHSCKSLTQFSLLPWTCCFKWKKCWPHEDWQGGSKKIQLFASSGACIEHSAVRFCNTTGVLPGNLPASRGEPRSFWAATPRTKVHGKFRGVLFGKLLSRKPS